MAVTKVGPNIVKLGAASDEYNASNPTILRSIIFEHSAAANCTIVDSAGGPIAMMRVGTADLHEQIRFPHGLRVYGVKATTLSAGNLYLEVE